MAAQIVIDSNDYVMGGDVAAEVSREAPAQAELRPTCAGAVLRRCPYEIPHGEPI
jgi:hypothetical protein